MQTYPKIDSPYKRFTEGPLRNRLDDTAWTRPEFAYLASLPWVWTEKIDGTNIRAHWDGYKWSFAGRTDAAQIPPALKLDAIFLEELAELAFGSTPATLFGEGYGGKIQKGGIYRPDESFILFDVKIGDYWLRRTDVFDVAAKLGIDAVRLVGVLPVYEAITIVRNGHGSHYHDGFVEGLVGYPEPGLLDRAGNRIQMKIKTKDFFPR